MCQKAGAESALFYGPRRMVRSNALLSFRGSVPVGTLPERSVRRTILVMSCIFRYRLCRHTSMHLPQFSHFTGSITAHRLSMVIASTGRFHTSDNKYRHLAIFRATAPFRDCCKPPNILSSECRMIILGHSATHFRRHYISLR